MSVEITLQRSPHDREHPYTPISNALLDNFMISNDLKMLLIYCLRKPSSWIFNIKYILKALDVGKTKLYEILDEGISSGYIERHTKKFDGNFQNTHYSFSESPIFKKCSPCSENTTSETLFENEGFTRQNEGFSKNDLRVRAGERNNNTNTSKTIEFEQPKAEIRKDIAKLSFGERDKRILSKYSEEAIEYAKRCISRMPRKPDSEIKVFMSLCESYTNNPKQSTGRKKKATPEDLAAAEINKKIFMSDRMAPLRRIFSLEPDRIVAKIDGNEYAISLYCDLFEEQIKITIGSINDQINHSS